MNSESHIPSVKSIIIPVLLLLIFYNIEFYRTGDKNTEKARYDWKNIKLIDSISPIKILSVSRTNLKLISPENFVPSANPTYALSNKKQYYFFRFEYRTKHHDTIIFFDVHWLNGLPKRLEEITKIKWWDLPLKSPWTQTAVTIGDAFICRGDAEYLRLALNQKSHLKFLGSQKDVFNFGYLAVPQVRMNDLLKYAQDAPKAQYYILFFKPPKNIEINQLKTYLTEIRSILEQKQANKIFWILSDRLSGNLKEFNSRNNIIIDYHFDYQKILPSKKIYETIAEKISHHIYK